MKNGSPGLLNHFFLPEDQHLFDYDQIFSVSAMWIELGKGDIEATYDLSVRSMPQHRNFLLFGGLEEIVTSICAWKFTEDEVQYLLENKIITDKMAKKMRRFSFAGDIWAMPEGTVFFPGEPVVRLTGPLWQINLFTFFLINALTSNTIFFSKIVRSMLAGRGKVSVVTCPVTRAHSNESSLKFGRAAYLLGAPSNIVPAFARKYHLLPSRVNTKAYHAFIKSFPDELTAMRAATSVFPNIGLMVDTYDVKQGIKHAITVAKELLQRGKETISALVLDSGKDVADFAAQARYARKELDQAGLRQVRITVTGNFEERRIAELVRMRAPVDTVIACTELVTSSDDPKLEAVVKLVEYRDTGKIQYAAKLTQGKVSYPGKKQVFRLYRNKKMARDIIGLAGERLGAPLLQKIVSRGKLAKNLPTLDEIRLYTKKQLEVLPVFLKRIDKIHTYKVGYSRRLEELLAISREEHHVDKDENRIVSLP